MILWISSSISLGCSLSFWRTMSDCIIFRVLRYRSTFGFSYSYSQQMGQIWIQNQFQLWFYFSRTPSFCYGFFCPYPYWTSFLPNFDPNQVVAKAFLHQQVAPPQHQSLSPLWDRGPPQYWPQSGMYAKNTNWVLFISEHFI